MAYIEFKEYTTIRGLETLSSSEFETYSMLAKDIVDGLTFGVIEDFDLANNSQYRPRIVRAMALIIDSIHRNGGQDYLLSLDSRDIASESESIGSYSHSVSYRDSKKGTIDGVPIPPRANILLMPIKALGRGRR